MLELIDRLFMFWLNDQAHITRFVTSMIYLLSASWAGWRLREVWPRPQDVAPSVISRLEALLAWLGITGFVGAGLAAVAHLIRVYVQLAGTIYYYGIQGEGFSNPDWSLWATFVPGALNLAILLLLLRWVRRDGPVQIQKALKAPGLVAMPRRVLAFGLLALIQWLLTLTQFVFVWGYASATGRTDWGLALGGWVTKLLVALWIWKVLNRDGHSSHRSMTPASLLLLWAAVSGALLDGLYRLWRIIVDGLVLAGRHAAHASGETPTSVGIWIRDLGESASLFAGSPVSWLASVFVPASMLLLAWLWIGFLSPRAGTGSLRGGLERSAVVIAASALMSWPVLLFRLWT